MTPLDCNTLHEVTLQLLEDPGIRIEHEAITARLIKAGARAGGSSQVVRFPASMVREYLSLAPSAIDLAARRGPAVHLSALSEPCFWTNPALNIVRGRHRRLLRSTDLARIARLCDHLDNVHGVMGTAMSDVPPPCRDITGIRIMAANCTRHLRAVCMTPVGMEALAAMKPVFPGNWFSIGFTAHGPLRWTNLALEIFLKSAGHGIPTTINGEPMAGVTGPVTLAGNAAVGNAEILAGIVINQLLEPGRPVIYNLGLAHVFDMRHATAVTGGPENALLARISAAMGRYYNLPSASWVSTESVCDDAQASLEKMFGYTMHMQDGVSLIWGIGQLESELTLSLAQFVIDDEMIHYIRRYRRGFTVNADSLQVDLIRQTGNAGSFLDSDHTLQNFRENLFEPSILNRKPRDTTSKPLDQIAAARAEDIINADTEPKIGDAELKELMKIERRFRRIILAH